MENPNEEIENKVEPNKSIQILLSTFNGEKYLREQLDSYLNLNNYNTVKVLIRDDGSTDHTIEILNEYNQKYGFEVVMGENIGVIQSIIWLFNHCDLSCNYFAISDQDDVWLPEKLELAVNNLSNFADLTPAMFASCSQIVDEELNPLGSSIVPRKGISFFNAIIQNVTPGHTQVINRAMIQKLIKNGFQDIHIIDWWLYIVASGIGNIIFENRYTVLHRQHRHNVVGYETNFWKHILNNFKKVLSNKSKRISLQLHAFYSCYGYVLDKEKKEEVKRFFSCQNDLFHRIKYVASCRAFRQNSFETKIFKLLYVLGKFNV